MTGVAGERKPEAVGGVPFVMLGLVFGVVIGYAFGLSVNQPAVFEHGRFAQRCLSAGGEVRDGKCWTKAQEIRQ